LTLPISHLSPLFTIRLAPAWQSDGIEWLRDGELDRWFCYREMVDRVGLNSKTDGQQGKAEASDKQEEVMTWCRVFSLS
jgi:hypothetical protein